MRRRGVVRSVLALGVLAGVTTFAPIVVADTVLVPRVEMTQTGDAQYVLEAVLSPRVVGLVRIPVLPERCSTVSEPSFSRDDEQVIWRYEFKCSDALNRTDVLYLPWTVDGIRLAATWNDGEAPERLFGRGGPGIVVPIDVIMLQSESPVAVAVRYIPAGLQHALTGCLHYL